MISSSTRNRPRNSGHYSVACDFLRFDTHILGVLGAPLPAYSPPCIIKYSGAQPARQAAETCDKKIDAHLHLYMVSLEAKLQPQKWTCDLVGIEPDSGLRIREKGLIFK